MAIDCNFARMVKNISKPRETRGEVVGYYQSRYPGVMRSKKGEPILTKKGEEIPLWKSKLSEALQPFTVGKNGKPQVKDSIMRRFQARGAKRWEDIKPSKKQQEEYKKLGAKLPYLPPEEGINISGTLCMKYQDDPCEDRDFDIDMTDDDYEFFLQSYDPQSIVNVYMMAPADYGLSDEPGRQNEIPAMRACTCPQSADGECTWDIEIAPLGEGFAAPTEKPKPNKGFTSPVRRTEIFKEKKPRKHIRREGPAPLTPDEVTKLFQ